MESLSDAAIEIVNELHKERLDYNSEYLPLIDALNHLAAYEDTGLEPQTISEILDSVSEWYDAHKEGRLLVLPCKAGDMVFYIRGQHIIGDDVKRIVLDGISGQVIVDANHCYLFSDFGETVFRTREEAEAKLKEMDK